MTNKTAQFTPGQLETTYEPATKTWGVCLPEGGDVLAQLVENKADATLFAAAPAMYEALAKLRLEAIHYRNTGVGKQFLNEAIAQAEQAINQVWGEGNHDTKREG